MYFGTAINQIVTKIITNLSDTASCYYFVQSSPEKTMRKNGVIEPDPVL